MMLAFILGIGFAVGFVARRYRFCIFGAITELLMLGSLQRLFGVFVAVLLFGLVQMGGYQHGPEHPGLIFFVGGLAQGIGYFLAMGCPLSLLVRTGEGSKFHFVVFAGLVAGLALYTSTIDSFVSTTLGAIQTDRAVTLLDLFR